MRERRIEFSLLVGREVHDEDGSRVGRLEDAGVEERGCELLIVECHVGAAALLERIGLSFVRLLGIPIVRQALRMPWDQLDLGDGARPRFRGKRRSLGR